MLTFIFKRIFFEAIPTLLIIITLTFFMVRLAPGNPFAQEKSMTPQALENLNAYYGLDNPPFTHYLIYMKGLLLKGDMGPSYKYPNRTVKEIIATSFPVSLELGFYALVFALCAGLGAGLIGAVRPNTRTDYIPMALAMTGICTPNFVLGPLLVLVFGLGLGWVNVAGWYTPGDRILPALTLGAMYAAYIARLTRGGMLEVLHQDFIRTARAKGVSESMVILKHALKGGILPVISFMGPATAGLISGSFVVETIFQIPGLGQYFIKAALNRDHLLILGTVIFFAGLIIMLNTTVDILLVWLNPKLKFGE